MAIDDLISYFREDLFFADFIAETKEDALDKLVEKFVDAGIIKNKELVSEMLHRRESIGSTGIGKGIAVPHGRTTAAPNLTIAFAKVSDGLEWDSLDGQPVHLIFVVVAPPFEENNLYLPVLGRLVEFLSKESNRDRLKDVTSYDEFKELLTE
ncbi:MAG: PTS sugar transporter subunit IIA [Deferribacteres bacterium]|nr:PTS sugar transporter subunit IIA [candidate division KSB1 bacterium]MCB9501766.1 PTS sugar transporter subunit IIA [Deferribacteres bacterium]